MAKIKTSRAVVKDLMIHICTNEGLSLSDADVVVANYLEAETLGKRTHGISKFIFESQFFKERQGYPKAVVDTGPLLKLDGNKEVGPIAADYAVKLASERAKQYGISIVGMNNIQRYGILRTWARQFSDQQLFGIAMNTCESAMVGYGGKKKVLGTNPLSFAIPVKNKTYVVDMSSSEVAMSLIWQCLREGSELPLDTFYDSEGVFTRDPKEAKAVKGFGGIKGYNVALLIQMMCGPLFGFKTASGIKDMYDIGYIFIAIDPDKTTDYARFIESNTALVVELEQSGAVIPGARSVEKENKRDITIEEDLLVRLQLLGGEI